MIITETKPIEELLAHLDGYKKIAILGCGRCATSCQTGGEKQVAEMGKYLSEKGFDILHKEVIEAQCDERLTKKSLKKIPEVDAYISMACGSGTSALSDITQKPVVPTNNTLFLGVIKRIGEYDERCSMCGDCVLTETMGVCVNTRCSKTILNGPCGGSKDGSCEVDDCRDCAWALVVERLKREDNLQTLTKKRTPRKTHQNSRPRTVTK